MDLAVIARGAKADAERVKMYSPPVCPADAFNAFSLLDWLSVCTEVDVPAVPGREAAHLSLSLFRRFDHGDPNVRERIGFFYQQCRAALYAAPGSMLRWDACASYELKHAMAQGESPPTGELPPIGDPRAFDIIAQEYGETVVPMIVRPWIHARRHEGWPVEFRAFVWDGAVRGVSTYYPQHSLETLEGASRLALNVWRYAAMLAWALSSMPVWWAHNERMEAPPRACFTADFIVSDDNTVLFLEGGPPHIEGRMWGAHPCCFEGRAIEGVALASRANNKETIR